MEYTNGNPYGVDYSQAYEDYMKMDPETRNAYDQYLAQYNKSYYETNAVPAHIPPPPPPPLPQVDYSGPLFSSHPPPPMNASAPKEASDRTPSETVSPPAESSNALDEGELESDEEDDSWDFCDICNQKFESQQQYTRHLRGMRHSQLELRRQRDEGIVMEESPARNHKPIVSHRDRKNYNNDPNVRDLAPSDLGDPHLEFNGDFYCKLCKVTCSSHVTYQTHVNGKRHEKNVRNITGTGTLPPNMTSHKESKWGNRDVSQTTEETGNVAEIQSKMDAFPQPLIGLQYVTEFVGTSPEPRYVCNLCHAKCDSRNIIGHLIGRTHRMKYLKDMHSELYWEVHQLEYSKTKQNGKLIELAWQLQQQEGRAPIVQKIEVMNGIKPGMNKKPSSGYSAPETSNRNREVPPEKEWAQQSCEGYNDEYYDYPQAQQNYTAPHNGPSAGYCHSNYYGSADSNQYRGGEHYGNYDECNEGQNYQNGQYGDYGDTTAYNNGYENGGTQPTTAPQAISGPSIITQPPEPPPNKPSDEAITKEMLAKILSSLTNAVQNDHDAEMAFKISKALTEALMKYRIKKAEQQENTEQVVQQTSVMSNGATCESPNDTTRPLSNGPGRSHTPGTPGSGPLAKGARTPDSPLNHSNLGLSRLGAQVASAEAITSNRARYATLATPGPSDAAPPGTVRTFAPNGPSPSVQVNTAAFRPVAPVKRDRERGGLMEDPDEPKRPKLGSGYHA